MPDIPNRTAHENTLAGELYGVFQANGGTSPNWPALEQQAREKLSAELLLIYLLMLGNMDDSFDIGIADAEADLLAADYAAAQANQVAADMTANMQAEFDQLVSARNAGRRQPIGDDGASLGQGKPPANHYEMPDEEFERRVEGIFGEGRAATVATTEITRAGSAAEQRAATIARAKDKNLVAVWNTEQDARVRPICEPLDQQPSEVFDLDFPGGPPAHPNCRCALSWVPEEELSAI